MVSTVLSRAQHGMDAPLVRVEVHLGSGLPRFAIVGLPEAIVKESKDRVRAAILNCNLRMPDGRITVNLSPADVPKEGVRFDLPIAVGILVASEQVGQPAVRRLRAVRRAVARRRDSAGARCAARGDRRWSRGSSHDRAAAQRCRDVARVGWSRRGAQHLLDVVAHAAGSSPLKFVSGASPPLVAAQHPDLCEVHGQAQAKRALEIAAAGEHSLVMIGPPGTGKSMLAQRLPGLLPPMSEDEALEVAALRSVSGLALRSAQWRARPFRSPHHTSSAIALVGGGSGPRPGEVSLAHHGVLFLDELPEFDRGVLEVLREPLENGAVDDLARRAAGGIPGDVPTHRRDESLSVRISRRHAGSVPVHGRASAALSQPAVGSAARSARSARGGAARADAGARGESGSGISAVVAARVARTREQQIARQGTLNARLNNKAVERFCVTTREAIVLLNRATTTLGLSARAYHRILKVARTIADLAQAEPIEARHVGEALALRVLDRTTSCSG